MHTSKTKDLHVRYRPGILEEFWNYPRDPGLQRLIRNMKSDRLSTVVILTGPFSSGKTTVATYLGQWSSCMQWRNSSLPCGDCDACREVRFGCGNLRCGFIEVDCGWDGNDGAADRIVNCFNNFLMARKGDLISVNTDNPRRRVLFLDEVQRLSGRVQDMLLKRVEKLPYGIVILATDDVKKIDGGLRSRAMEYTFLCPTLEDAVPHLIRIAKCEGFTLQPDAALLIADSGSGNPRDCLTLLQETMSFERTLITVAEVQEIIDCNPSE